MFIVSLQEPFVCRSSEEFKRDAIAAQETKTVVNGIKGRCFLDDIIDIPGDVPIDAMHQVHLGCAKSIISALVGSLSKHDLPLAEQRLKNMTSPRNLYCKPKLLSELPYWKARDFKFFLLHYGSFCFEGLVRDHLHRSFNQLSIAIRLLSMRVASETNIKDAEKLLFDFLSNFVELYGSDSQSFNFHSLRHLGEQVRQKGPLWRNSAFAFESANHFLLSSVNGTKKSLSHLVDSFLLRQQNVAQVTSERHYDEKFTIATEDCRRFALLECGPGKLSSRNFFSSGPHVLCSLSYSRLGDNWRECIARTKSGDFVVVVLYHRDFAESVTAICRKYKTKRLKNFVQSTESFYYEIEQLESNFFLVQDKDLLATRVVIVSGNLEKCLVSLVKEGFDHN